MRDCPQCQCNYNDWYCPVTSEIVGHLYAYLRGRCPSCLVADDRLYITDAEAAFTSTACDSCRSRLKCMTIKLVDVNRNR